MAYRHWKSLAAFAPWFCGVLVCGILQCTRSTAAEPVDLRGYGKVTASCSPGRAAFLCEDETRADWLLGKLQADLFWDAGDAATEQRLTVDSREVVARAWAPYGWIVLARVGKRVCAVGGDNAVASDGNVWARKAITKNGLQGVSGWAARRKPPAGEGVQGFAVRVFVFLAEDGCGLI